MRRAWALIGAAGVLCAVAGQIELSTRALAEGLSLSSAVLVAALTSGSLSLASEAASLADGGALGYEAARGSLPLLASGLLLTFVFGTRAMRATGWRELALHLVVAFVGGVAASWVVRADSRVEVTLWLLAVTIAALLSSVPWIVPSDGPRVLALRSLAARAEGPLRVRLLRAAAVARRLAVAPSLAARTKDRVRRAFEDVLALGERRVEGRGSVALEQDLARLVDQLGLIARAASRAGGAIAADRRAEALDAALAALTPPMFPPKR